MAEKKKEWKMPKIEHGKLTEWNWLVHYPEKFFLGKNTDIGAFTFIDAREGVKIEDNVMVGGGCLIYSYSASDGKRGRIVLKKGCKIGANTVILPNVTVGENAFVGACSLVNSDIPENAIAFGCPAKVRKKAGKKEADVSE